MRYYVATTNDSTLVHPSVEFRDQFVQSNRDVRCVTIVDRPDDADIVVLFEAWSLKLQSYADQLLACPFFREYAARVLVVNYDDAGTAFLPGCYTSLTRRTFDPMRYRASCYPKAYNRHVAAVAAQRAVRKARWLCTFRGNTRHQPVRQRLMAQLRNVPEFRMTDPGIVFHAHDHASQLAYLEEIAESEFVLCPRGESPSTYRMFEVMQMGRCPVIVSDDWQPVSGIPWDTCSLRIGERDISDLPQILSARRGAARTLGEQARVIWERHFEDQAKFRLYASQLAELHTSRRTQGEVGLDSLRRFWMSSGFRQQRGWLLSQRLRRAPRRILQIVRTIHQRRTAGQAAPAAHGVES